MCNPLGPSWHRRKADLKRTRKVAKGLRTSEAQEEFLSFETHGGAIWTVLGMDNKKRCHHRSGRNLLRRYATTDLVNNGRGKEKTSLSC